MDFLDQMQYNENEDDGNEEWSEPFNEEEDSEHRPNENTMAVSSYKKPVSKIGHCRTMIHFDIDCFYAQVEMLRNPELKGKPLGIQQKNIVVTSNYEARKLGVNKLTYVADAINKCPDLVLVSGEDLTHYRQMSYQISEFIQKYTPDVERLGFDENFVDVSEMVTWRLNDGNYRSAFVGHEFGSDHPDLSNSNCNCGCKLRLQIGSQIAADIREALSKELGITCCAGIAHNKVLAKLVGSINKPNQQTSILPHMACELMMSLPSVRSIPGIGSRTSKRLLALQISTIHDLQQAGVALEKEFGQVTAHLLSSLSFGVDDSPVVTFSQPQTLSDEDSFKCCNDYEDAEERAKNLLTSLLKRVIEDGRIPGTIRLTVRHVKNYQRESRQCPVQASMFAKCQQTGLTETACERLMPVVMSLFKKLIDPSKPFHLTLMNICFAKLMKPGQEDKKISSFFLKSSSVSPDKPLIDLTTRNKEPTRVPLLKSGASKSDSQKTSPGHFFQKTFKPVKLDPKQHFADDNRSVQKAQNYRPTPLSWQNSQSNVSPCADNVELSRTDVNDTTFNSTSSKAQNVVSEPKVIIVKETENSISEEKCPILQTSKEHESLKPSHIDSTPAILNEEDITLTLQNLLPNGVDAKTITELPNDIQKEILAQYGILVHDLPEGRQFTLASRGVVTRSCTPCTLTVKSKKKLFSPPKTKAGKRKAVTGGCVEGAEKDTDAKIKKMVPINQQTNPLPMNEMGARTENTLKKLSSSPVIREINVPDCEKDNCSKMSEGKSDINTDVYSNITGSDQIFPKYDRICQSHSSASHLKIETEISPSSLRIDKKREYGISGHDNMNCIATQPADNKTQRDTIRECISYQGQILNTQQSSIHTVHKNDLLPCKNATDVKHGKMPDNIDSEVFSSLPSNIRGEIMAHIAMGSLNSPDLSCLRSPTKSKNVKHKESTGKKPNQNTLLTYFKKQNK